MKKIFTTVLGAIMFVNANAARIDVKPFNNVMVNIPAKIHLVMGDEYSVRIKGENKYIKDAVKISVNDSTLNLNTKNIEYFEMYDVDSLIEIYITTPTLTDVNAGRNFLVKQENYNKAMYKREENSL